MRYKHQNLVKIPTSKWIYFIVHIPIYWTNCIKNTSFITLNCKRISAYLLFANLILISRELLHIFEKN